MKKRILCTLLAMSMVYSMAGCAASDDSTAADSSSTGSGSTASASNTAAQTSYSGTVTSISSSSITVSTDSGDGVTAAINDITTITRGGPGGMGGAPGGDGQAPQMPQDGQGAPDDARQSLTGAVLDDESSAGNGGDGYAALYLDSTSKWVVTGDSTVTNLYNAGTIVDANGNTVSVVGTDGTVYVQGASQYTITVTSYSTSVDTSAAATADSWSDYEVEKA